MLTGCEDPSALTGMAWFACYLTTGKHMAFYMSFGTVLLLLALTAPAARCSALAGGCRAVADYAASLVRAGLYGDGARRSRNHLLSVRAACD